MPIFKTKNENFFKKWNSEMAYVLGFFCADGNMMRNKRGACFLEFQITDGDLLEKIKTALDSNHKITARKRDHKFKTSYRLQIGSKIMFNDLTNLGIVPKKSKILAFPKIPKKYLNDFIRGYFDGDGHVTISNFIRANRNNSRYTTILSGFTSGSRIFLKEMLNRLKKFACVAGGTLYYNKGYRLCFSVNDSLLLYKFLYKNLNNDLYLCRKKKVFEKYFKIE